MALNLPDVVACMMYVLPWSTPRIDLTVWILHLIGPQWVMHIIEESINRCVRPYEFGRMKSCLIATKVVVGVVGFVNHNRLIGSCLELKILKSLFILVGLGL